jgi:hypothetical protein
VEQITGTTTGGGSAQPQQDTRPADGAAPAASPASSFGSRGRMRRRVRFLRRARELGYRDLGGLVFNLHRFGQRNDELVLAKLTLLGHIDEELRTLESALAERSPITVLREAGITACPRCAAIHGSEDRFCPNCGLSLGKHPDLPIAAVAASPGTVPAATAPAPAPAQAEVPAQAQTQAPAQAQAEGNAGGHTPPDGSSQARTGAGAPATAAVPAAAPAAQGGRAPSPPARAAPPPREDEVTEIIHPPAHSS